MERAAAQRLGATVAGLLSLLAGFLHGSLAQEHLREWWGYGVVFLAASIAQGLYGLVLLALPRRPAWADARWDTWQRRFFLWGAAGNLAVIALYGVTRTVGIPLFGPQAAQVEAVGHIDLVILGAEAAAALWLAWLAMPARGQVTHPPQAA